MVGVSAGVRIYAIEKYITPQRHDREARIIELTSERWILELYRTIIESLQGIAWMLLVFFVFALIAYPGRRVGAGYRAGSARGPRAQLRPGEEHRIEARLTKGRPDARFRPAR